MRFDTTSAPPPDAVRIGDVYATKGPGPARYWLVAAVSGTGAHCLGLDQGGDIVTTASYGQHALRERDLIGRCEQLADTILNIEWRGPRA